MNQVEIQCEDSHTGPVDEQTQHKLAVPSQIHSEQGPATEQAKLEEPRHFFKASRGVLILAGLLTVLIILGGIGIGMTIAMSSNMSVVQKTHIQHSGSRVTEITEVRNSKLGSAHPGYRVFATRSLSQGSSRLLTRDNKPDIDVHFVFGDNSEIVITVHSDETVRIHLNTEVLADQIAAENQAFQEILQKYSGNSTDLAD